MKLARLRPDDRGELPLIPLRELVVFPHNVIPFFVGRPGSLKALNAATSSDREIFLAFQKSASDDPSPEDIHPIGTVARVVQVLKLPDGNMRVLVEGRYRARLKKIHQKKDVTWGSFKKIPDTDSNLPGMNALMQTVKDDFEAYAKLRKKKLPKEAIANVVKSDGPDKLVGHICSSLEIDTDQKIKFLLETDVKSRLEEDLIHPIWKLWQVIHKLAELCIFLSHTDHLSDCELYAKLWDDTLREEETVLPNEMAMDCFIDVLGDCCDEGRDLALRYCDNEWEREEWAALYPEMTLPPSEKPPFSRDKDLPQRDYNPN